MNLPQRIEFTLTSSNKLGVIEFVYDATGAKLRKIVSQSCLNPAALCEGYASNTYDYVNGVEYKNGALERVAHAEGSLSKNAHTGAFEQEYVLRDHLGNTRVTFSDSDNDGHVTAADIKQINHYYPFGLNMEGNWNGAQGNNKYQYNQKEWNDDFGLGWNDYGKRFYDPAIGRFLRVDRIADTFPNLSPYQYADNNPICKYDFKGDSIIVLSAPSGANGMGHGAVLIGNEKDGWNLYSKNGTRSSSGTKGASDKDPQVAVFVGKLADFQTNGDGHGNKYTEGYMLSSDFKTDAKMAAAAKAQVNKDYDLLNASCIDVCSDALQAGGFNGGQITVEAAIENVPISVETISPIPNGRYQDIKNNNPEGTTIFLKMNPNK